MYSSGVKNNNPESSKFGRSLRGSEESANARRLRQKIGAARAEIPKAKHAINFRRDRWKIA